jgi:serine/threonine-protein kinase
MGGSCAFSVNGASKGTSTSLKLSLKPGAYTVLCRPSSGASKSKSVTVKSGETAMAAFKL